MRRPPGLWILLSAGVVWLSLQDVYGIRATSLIFGKSTTTTTTSTTTTTPEQPEASEEETVTTELGNDANATKPTLTGNPQVDYIWDPNLPKELNGYNLSDYPFYERVPEEIDFKCDGLHDGFYASVIHKCQVYHHCLFGVRYDFLCANYTAFDQTLFNCNFVSNVDCENSKKYWHRNDELYKEKSTTTAAPVAYNFYTPPSRDRQEVWPLTPSPVASAPSAALSPAESLVPRRPVAPRARPYGRGRPQYDYYEEEYEELPRPKGRTRRPRPRPIYYDDYEDYEDERFVRRRGGRRRPYSRRDRPMRRNKERRKLDYDDADYRYEYDDVVPGKKQKEKRRKPVEDYEYEDDRRDRYEKRRSLNRRNDKPPRKADKRPTDDDYDYEEDERYIQRKAKEESRGIEKRLPLGEENKKIPRLGKRRPPSEDYEDDLQRADNPRPNERTRKSNEEGSYSKAADDGRPIIKPVSGTIYDRPRVAPRINLPVPKNAAQKFAYKAVGSPTTQAPLIDEDYDDYEDLPIKQSETDKKVVSSTNQPEKVKNEDNRGSSSRSNSRTKLEISKNLGPSTALSINNGKSTITEEYEDYEDSSVRANRLTKKSTSALVATATTESIIEHPMPVIRKFKRPLSSRGSITYSRTLQLDGGKAGSKNEGVQDTEASSDPEGEDLSSSDNDEIQDMKPNLKPVPVRVKSPLLLKVATTIPTDISPAKETNNEEAKQGPIRIKVPIRVVSPLIDQDARSQNQNQQGYKSGDPIASEQAKLTESDILNGNYDIALNEAISPIIPKLPVPSFGGFSTANDYAYKRIQRPTKYVILDPVVSGGAYYVK